MSSGRCAACKYLRRRCALDCIFAPYFPSNDPQRFASVHRIYGASNVAKFLQQVEANERGSVADSLCYEAKCRIEEPVYGCVGIISELEKQVLEAQHEIALINAQIAILASHFHC